MKYLEWARMLGNDGSDSQDAAMLGMLSAPLRPPAIPYSHRSGWNGLPCLLLCRVLDKHSGRNW